jgi:hypothetical protein
MILDHSRWRPAGPARVALFDHAMVDAIGRWPSLMVALSTRNAQQVARLSAQLMICQLSRVEDRVLSLLWLLAESWGRVNASGTRLPLDLTHEAIGMMVGARRPTISLALRDLTEDGALVRQPGGWLLLRTPAHTFTGNPAPSDSPAWAPELAGDALAAGGLKPKDVLSTPPAEALGSADALRELMTALWPASLTAARPAAPSPRVPDRTTPITRPPLARAAVRNSTSTAGR